MQLPQYVISLLDEVAQKEGFTNYNYKIAPGTKHGDNFIAVLTAIVLTGDRVKAGETITETLNLVCKTVPESKERRQTFRSIPAFEREIVMYTRVLPLFVELQRDKGLTADESFLSFPKVYGTRVDRANDHYALIMEDLRPKQFYMWPRQDPISLAHEKLLLQQLGRFHGVAYALKDQRPEVFAEFKALDDIVIDLIENGYARPVIDDCLERAVKVLKNDDHKKVVDKFQNSYFDVYKSFFTKESIGKFGIINHGDCWVNNFLFQYTENVISKPTFP